MILGVTGHRPDRLGGYSPSIFFKLVSLSTSLLKELDPHIVITGMALGWDQAVAQSAIDLKIPFIAAIPFPEQPNRWPTSSIEYYNYILNKAADKVVVSDQYSGHALSKRNEWIVDNSELILALWNRTPSGTGNCVKYAIAHSKEVINVWDRFLEA